MSKQFGTETELARAVIEYLAEQHFEIYQEVQPYTYGSVADIVGTCGPVLIVCECKLNLGLAVLEQAKGWVGWANQVYVAAPHGRRDSNFSFACKISEMLGVGVLSVSHSSYEHDKYSVKEMVRPAFYRKSQQGVFRKVLTEQHKTFAEAGNSHGKHFTPFQGTCERLREFVSREPGLTMKEIIGQINTHYATPTTARATLSRLIWSGVIDGVRLEKDGKYVRVYPKTIDTASRPGVK